MLVADADSAVSCHPAMALCHCCHCRTGHARMDTRSRFPSFSQDTLTRPAKCRNGLRINHVRLSYGNAVDTGIAFCRSGQRSQLSPCDGTSSVQSRCLTPTHQHRKSRTLAVQHRAPARIYLTSRMAVEVAVRGSEGLAAMPSSGRTSRNPCVLHVVSWR